MSFTEGDNILDRLRDAINSHEAVKVAACFTADYVCERPLRPSEGFTGRARVQENWEGMFARLPDLKAEVVRHARSGNEIWSEWEMLGVGPDGNQAVFRGPVILTTHDGRINWTRFYLDPVTAGA